MLFSAIGLVVLIGAGVAVWFLLLSRQAEPVAQTPEPQEVVVTQEQIERAREIVGITGKFVSVDESAKQLVLETESGEKSYAFTDETTVHKGAAAVEQEMKDIPAGQMIALTYDSKATEIMDIWYNDAP